MKSKKIISSLLALTFVFGGAVVPSAIVDNTVISASAEKCGSYYYNEFEDGTVSIIDYSDPNYETDIVIPSELDGKTVTKISSNAFNGSKIKSVTIPDTVQNICSQAFAFCSELKEVNLPSGLKTIGAYAFKKCSSLENITLPEGLKSIGEGAFLYCDSLKSIEIPSTVTFIGATAFYADEKMESITFAEPSSLYDIDSYAFYGCKSLKELTLPDNIKHIGEEAFGECINLKKLSLPNNSTTIKYGAFAFNPGLESVIIPDKTTSIAALEFCRCENLKEVTIPASVTSIGTRAFDECSKDLVINCYKDTAAHKYAESEKITYNLLDETEQTRPNCPPPIRVEYSEKYRQIRIKWTPIDGAEKYGIAVYLAGKWRIQTQDIPADTTTYTSPKNLTQGTTYKIVIAARVNGKWQTKNPLKNAVTVVVK